MNKLPQANLKYILSRNNFKNYNYYDPLFVVNSKVNCKFCQNDKIKRNTCNYCRCSGYEPVNLNGLWYPSPGFLVCGGPSLKKIDYNKLRERGIVSLAVNNVASLVPVTAWCFSDPQQKFHHGLFLDPKCLTFAPIPKLKKHIMAKLPDKMFRATDIRVRHCPGTFGFSRTTLFNANEFLTSPYAHWGRGGKQPDNDCPFNCLCTMLIGFRLMHYLGCPRIYLLGVDLWMTDEQPYAFPQKKRARNHRYIYENEYLKELKPIFDKVGFEVFNCNPESKCDVFPYVPFDVAFQDCKGAVPNEPFDTLQYYDKHIHEQHIKQNPQSLTLNELRNIYIQDRCKQI